MNSSKKNLLPALGDLEIAVLEVVWAEPGSSAKEVHAAIGDARGIGLNTVQSTLERLHRKGLLARTKQGHAFRYRSRVDREHLIAGLIRDLFSRLGGDPAASLAAFVEINEDLDEDALKALAEKLESRRSGKGGA